MKNIYRNLFIVLFAGMLLINNSCKDQDGKTDNPPPPPKPKLKVPSFQKDSAYAFVAKQVSFGPRVMNSKEHEDCKNWLVSKLKGYTPNVIEQNFSAKAYTGITLNGTNIIARFNPQSHKRIVLAAHWDSRHIADSELSTERRDEPILGADDGGSGVGVLLEIARQLKENPIDIGVDLVLFDAEDYGENGGDNSESWALGSQYWAKNLHVAGYKPKYGILLDMVGAANPRFAKEYISKEVAPQLVDKIWKLAQNMGYANFFDDANAGAVTDDHYFVIKYAGIPMIDIINKPVGTKTGFGNHWHTHNDNMDIINKRTLKAVGQVMLAVIYRESNGNF